MRYWVLAALVGVLGIGAAGPAASADAAALGQRLYREGLSVTGEPLDAVVQGDVPLLGTQVTCRSCHGLSGMGTIESGRIPLPLAGPMLFSDGVERPRPAYDQASLARALREGVDPAGRRLDALMPRFAVSDRDVEALAAYLKTLGATTPPGISLTSLHVATVVAGDVDRERELGVIEVLETFIADRNRMGPQRLRGGRGPEQWKETFREWSHDVWRLTGPSDTWTAQLAEFARSQPTYALIGGLTSGTWRPVHEFCEATRMPCVLPDVDLPPAASDDLYSIYYSRGLRLEAELMAAAIAETADGGDVVAIHGDGSTSAPALDALRAALVERGFRPTVVRADDAAALAALDGAAPASAVVLWLGADALEALAGSLRGPVRVPVLMSSTLLEGRQERVPVAFRGRGTLVRLTRLPDEADPALTRFRIWARVRGVPLTHEDSQALIYFAAIVFAENLKHMQRYTDRDYFLDLFEHASTLVAYLPLYPRGSITPGQRVLSRGGYLVDLSGRRAPVWLVP